MRSLLQHHRSSAIAEHAPLGMPLDGAVEHHALELAAALGFQSANTRLLAHHCAGWARANSIRKAIRPQCPKKFLAWDAKNTVSREPVVAAVEQVASALGIILSEVS